MMEFNMREFPFYLEAWKFCIDNKIALTKISKKDFRTWVVQTQ